MTEPASQNSPTALPSTLELDVQKLHSLPSEQQELFLLTFTADLVRFVDSLDGDGASAHQIHVKKTLFQIINLGHPAPTRIIRNNIGRCFAGIFKKGNRKLLFESINELVVLVGGPKSEKDGHVRHAAIHCLGTVYEAAGDSAISLSSLVYVTLLKSLKSLSGQAGIRASIFQAFGRLYSGIGAAADESLSRDAWRQARSAAAGDKSHLVQLRACDCLRQMIEKTDLFDNTNDYEKLQSAINKAIESPSAQVRHAAAFCWSQALVKSYSEAPKSDSIIKPKKPKRTAKRGAKPDGEKEEIERPDSPAPQKPATALSFSLTSILKQLSGTFYRPATSNKARAAIAICYIMTFRQLGEGVVENQYGNIARHLFNDILSHPAIANTRYRSLLTRQFIKIILEDVIGKEILGESAQLRAAKCLVSEILKDYPQTLKERPEPSKQALIGALSTLSSLALSLGDAFNSLADSCRDVLLQVITHPSYTVQVYAAQCLKNFVYACPQQMLPCLTICMNGLTRELGQISTAWQTPRRCVGLANGLAAILSVSTDQPLYGSVDVYSRLLSQATTLLKSSGSSSDLRISSTQIQVAWILLGGLMTLGPNFVKIHTSQLMLLWKNALPKPVNRENISQRNILELSFLAHVRECALGSILIFLQHNKRLLTLDVTRRLASMLHNTTMFLASLPSKKTTDDISQRLSPALQLHDFDLMVRRRVLQCYTKLIIDTPQGSNELLLQSSLLPFTMSCFATPDDYAPSSISASIASSAGTFDSIWDVDDNYGFGVNTLVHGYNLEPFPGESEGEDSKYWLFDVAGYSNIESSVS
jgi:HEAT repeat-containing protein 5